MFAFTESGKRDKMWVEQAFFMPILNIKWLEVTIMRRHLLYGSYTDKSGEVLQTGASVFRDRIRTGLLIVLALAVAAMAVIGGQAVAYRSEARALYIATMQTECTEALSMTSSLSRTAGASSSTTLGRIRANVHTMEAVNRFQGNLEGGHPFVPEETFSALYALLDSYGSRLLTGMNTGDLQGDLQTALETLQTTLSGL